MDALPKDMELELMSHLKPAEIATLCQTNSSYASLCSQELLWEKLVSRDFAGNDKIGTWYNTYIYYSQKFYLVQKVNWQNDVTPKLFSNREKAINYIIRKCKHCENSPRDNRYAKWASSIFIDLWEDGRATAIQLIANNQYHEMIDKLQKNPEYISELLDGELSDGQELYLQLAGLTTQERADIAHDYTKYVTNNIKRIKKLLEQGKPAMLGDTSYELKELSLSNN